MIVVISGHDKSYEPLAEWTLHKIKNTTAINMVTNYITQMTVVLR